MSFCQLSKAFHAPTLRPLILGHRGASYAAPENTLAAFALAMAEGADGVELDVRLNASGQVVVAHDNHLQRVTAGRDERRVSELSTAQCAEVRLGDEQAVPSLESVLQWAEQCNALLNIELKTDASHWPSLVSATVAVLKRHRAHWPRIVLSSFGAPLVVAMGLKLPEVSGAWLMETPAMHALPWLPPAAAVHPNSTLLTPQRAARLRRQGLAIHCWTVDDAGRAAELAALRVNGLITNRPREILAVFR